MSTVTESLKFIGHAHFNREFSNKKDTQSNVLKRSISFQLFSDIPSTFELINQTKIEKCIKKCYIFLINPSVWPPENRSTEFYATIQLPFSSSVQASNLTLYLPDHQYIPTIWTQFNQHFFFFRSHCEPRGGIILSTALS